MSLTSQVVTGTFTSSTPAATRTADPLGRPLIPPDAVRFFIIAATVGVFFGSITCVCCIVYRRRKARMRRIVVAAFTEGIFDHETVQQRMAYMRRGDPNFEFPLHSAVPGYFDKLGKPIEIAKFNGDANVAKVNLLPLSAQVQSSSEVVAELQPRPHLSLLPLESQLALLFQASRHKEERKRRKVESSRLHELSAVTAQDPTQLVLSVVISMPRPAITSTLAEGGDGELAFGTAAFPWRYQVAETRPQTLTTEDATLAPARV